MTCTSSATSITCGHRVADEHHAEPAVAHPADQVKDAPGLHHPEGGGRLVEQDDPLAPRGRAGYRDRLLLTARHRADGAGEVAHGRAQVVERLLAAGPHRRLVHEPQPPHDPRAHDFAAQVHVLDGIEMRRQGQVLVHGLDPVPARGERSRYRHRLAVDQDLARGRRLGAGQDLDQRALARAVVTDESDNLARLHIEVGAGQRTDVAVHLRNVPCFQREAHRTTPYRLRYRREAEPPIPVHRRRNAAVTIPQ